MLSDMKNSEKILRTCAEISGIEGEADHVMLLTDLSSRFAQEYAANSDSIHRMFYVGVTRAKKSLHIVLPKNTNRGFQL